MDEIEYDIDCPVCQLTTQVIVEDSEEKPAHCPMCGSELDDDWEEE
jgi:uncharacterized paraquat-inducible protein A